MLTVKHVIYTIFMLIVFSDPSRPAVVHNVILEEETILIKTKVFHQRIKELLCND